MTLNHFAVDRLTRTRGQDFERDAERGHLRRHLRSNGKSDRLAGVTVITPGQVTDRAGSTRNPRASPPPDLNGPRVPRSRLRLSQHSRIVTAPRRGEPRGEPERVRYRRSETGSQGPVSFASGVRFRVLPAVGRS
jgi:hypothetical protein